MIDFPIMPDAVTKSSFLLGGTMYFGILAAYRNCLKSPLRQGACRPKFSFALLAFAFCLLAIYCGDWSHLQAIVKEIVGTDYVSGIGVEFVYHYLANLLNGNYFLFRTIVWGVGLICMLEAFRLSNLDTNRCLYFLFGIYITAFAYTRAGVALAVFYFGFVLLFRNKGSRKLWTILLGLAILSVSPFLHRSMLVLVCLAPLALIPVKKQTIVFILVGVVILAFVWQNLFEGILGDLMNSEEYAHRVELYEGESGSKKLTFDINGLFFLWYKAIVHLPFWLCVTRIYKLVNKGEVPFNIQAVFRFSILLYTFAMIMLAIYGSASAFYYRYEGMLYIPITIMANFLFQHKFVSQRKYANVFWICALSQCKDFIYRIFWW